LAVVEEEGRSNLAVVEERSNRLETSAIHLRIALILRANSTDSSLDSNTCSTRIEP